MGTSWDGATQLLGERVIQEKGWLDLWNAVINILCFQEREKQDIGEVNKALNEFIIDSKDHTGCCQLKASARSTHEPEDEVHETSRSMQANGHAGRIPDQYSRARTSLAAVDSGAFRKPERILEDAGNSWDADVT